MQKVTLFWIFLCFIYGVYTTDLCHSKCSCYETILKCTGLTQKDIESNDFYNSITASLESIHITGGTIPELPKNLLGSCAEDYSYRLDKLKKLDLQDNDIQIINQQSLHCMPNLEEIILANNQWNISTEHPHVFTTVPQLKKLNMSNAFNKQVDPKVHMANLQMIFLENQLEMLEVLVLDNNGFPVFDKDSANVLCFLSNLKRLNLAHNLLPKLTLYHIQCLPKLEYLDLSYNSIITFESETDHNGPLYSLDVIQMIFGNLTVNFYGNKFDCDCGLADFYRWLKNTKVHVIQIQELYCYDKQHFKQPIVSLETSDFTCHQDSESQSSNVTLPLDNVSASSNHEGSAALPMINLILFGTVLTIIILFMMRRQANRGKLNIKESVTQIFTTDDYNWKPLHEQKA